MTEDKTPKKSETNIPLEEVVTSLHAAQKKIYPRNTFGNFTNWRWFFVWITQLFFYGVPWLEWGQRQALLFDLETKRFYIFNLVFYPQDLIYLTAILIISALSLFLFTAIAGRLWCGFTCPQTVYTEIFLWFESKIEGDRAARIKLDESPMSSRKFRIKATKHFVWLTFSLWTGFTFVGYFTPIRELSTLSLSLQLSAWEIFWVLFYGFATYGNAGFLREQICKYMCPYARFQGAMFDDDTLVVTYDEKRGEPRGGRSRNADLSTAKLGSCIDCSLCVQVCPTGIDIRKGLQYECIQCGLCADVCNTIMDKMNYAPGLIKFSTQHGIANNWSNKQILQHIARPRVLLYTGILAFLVLSLVVSLWLRTPFRVDIVRDRSVMSRLSDDGMLENVYRLQVMNGTEKVQYYKLNASGISGIKLETDQDNESSDNASSDTEGGDSEDHSNIIAVEPAEARWLIVALKIPNDTLLEPGSHPIKFEVQALESKEIVSEKSAFLVPR